MEARVMSRKKIIIISVIVISLISLAVLLKNCVFKKVVDEVIDDRREEYWQFGEKRWDIGYEVAKKNGDWSDLPLSDKFREKYNENDGILGDIEYDKIEYSPSWVYDIDERFEDHVKLFVITQGKKKTAYTYIIFNNEEGLIDDVVIYETYLLYDDEGNVVPMPKYTADNLGIYFLFYKLGNGGEEEDSVAVTEKFHKKYPRFSALFNHNSPAGWNKFYLDEEKSDYANNMIYVTIDSILEKMKREYKVYYVFNEDGWLDDATVELVTEYPQDYHDKKYKWTYQKVLYRNSNWDDIEVTNHFREKFKPKDGIFPDPDLYNYLEYKIEYVGEKPEKSYYREHQVLPDGYKLYAYLMLDGHYHYYTYKSISDENGYLDDVYWERLPYIDMDIREVKKLYLESKGIKEEAKN